jgi:Fe(3+) dicitrate transport protein
MKKLLGAAIVIGMTMATPVAVTAQEAPPPAETPAPPAAEVPPPADVPEVEVIQETPPAPKPKPVAKKPKPKPAPAAAPPPAAEPEVVTAPEVVEPAADVLPPNPNPIYGSPAARGAAERARTGTLTPVNPTSIVPSDLTNFPTSATILGPDALTENQPRNMNEALTRVPGVTVINDDANAQHGGIAVRGSPARRSRKILVMEDGHSINLALWLDPSVHYWGPVERYESVEVLRGTIITHGPNNNFGVVNARNLSPFGPNETVVSSAIGFTKSRTGEFEVEGEDGDDDEIRTGGNDTDISARWHVHTRQMVDNVGLVLSYTGANVQGAWDTERLRFNDFYGALGFKGSTSDLVVSSVYARQRDNYDEQNFLGEIEDEAFNPGGGVSSDEAEDLFADLNRGSAERAFFDLLHCKTCYAPGSVLNTYAGDIWRGQAVYNYYLDDDTTVTSRLYAGFHRRNRFQTITPESFPDGDVDDPPVVPVLNDDTDPDGYFFGDDTMFGRLRTFRHVGAEVRTEWANRNILGFNQDIQAGIRYEYQDMTNRNFLGANEEILESGDKAGATLFDRSLDANAVSAFLQTNVRVASDFNVVPGIRFEWYQINRTNRVIAEEESEAEGADAADCIAAGFADGECLGIEGINFNPDDPSESYDSFNALPGVAFAYTGFKNTTVYGGYNRGMSTGVLRNENFPAPDEIGDNFNLGFRSTAIKGVDLEVAGFYQILQDYQFGATFGDADDRSFGRADKVEISGVELFGRVNSQPYTGGSLNFFGEGTYTYSRGIFKDLTIEGESFDGNRIPEVPLHVAALTLGVEQNSGWRWDASVTWTYRGSFFTDEANTGFGEYEAECSGAGPAFDCEIEEAGEDGEVPSVWLLSARANLALGDTGASIFVAGDNLLDEFYISDREDGMKPGLGRTIWTGFKYKF